MVAADLPSDVAGKAGEIATWLRQWQGLDAMQSAEIAAELQTGETEPPAERRGEALLEAMADIDAGLDGDLARAGKGLAMMRALGLNSDADLAAAQLTLLPQMKETPG